MQDKDEAATAREEAAYWYARLNSDDAPADERGFNMWLSRAPQNRAAWSALEQVNNRLETVQSHPAIAALLAEARGGNGTPAEKQAPPALISLTKASTRRITGFVQHHLPLAASLAIAIGIGGAFLWSQAKAPTASAQMAATRYATAIGERKTITLNDGSHVTLDTETIILVPQWGDKRDVTLVRGQALFSVAKDPAHPFIVTNHGRSVQALGTKFTVRDDDTRFSVALFEGKVRVAMADGGTQQAILAPGDLLVLKGRDVTIQHQAADEKSGWVKGRLDFEDMPLRTIIEEMNRYSKRKIVIADPRLGDKLFSGTFTVDGINTLLDALKAYHIAKIVHTDEKQVVIEAE